MHPHQQGAKAPFSPRPRQLLFSLPSSFHGNHSDRREVIVAHCGLGLHFPDLELVLLAMGMSSWGKRLFCSFAHFKSDCSLFSLSLLSCTSSLSFMDASLLTRHMICKYFLPFHRFPFHAVDSLAEQKLFTLTSSHSLLFAFVAWAFGVLPTKLSPTPTSRSFCLPRVFLF